MNTSTQPDPSRTSILKPCARLLSIGSDAKTVKGEKLGIRTAILYMKPGTLCPWMTEACKRYCLEHAGRGTMRSVKEARERKEVFFLQERQSFLAMLRTELRNHARTSLRLGMEAFTRLNGLTDIPWERIAPDLFKIPGLRFYDYTKSFERVYDYLLGRLPQSYSLTFSWSGENLQQCRTILLMGGSVSIPLMPETYDALFYGTSDWHRAYRPIRDLFGSQAHIVDGDEHDARPLNPMREHGSLILLRAKGSARHDRSGWVIGEAPRHDITSTDPPSTH